MGNLITVPGLVDMHVHLREPGFEYKEDILTGAAAAAAGGVTTCCCMSNTSPVADTPEIVEMIAAKGASAPVRVLPIGAVTIGQQGEVLTDFAALAAAGAVAVSDDGMPIVDDDVMRSALREAKRCGLLLISHCEDETMMAERDVRLAAEEGARVHIAHVSSAETVDVVRRAKAARVQVTAETCPHYFSLTSEEVARQGAMASMNPPLRTKRDVEAIIEGLRDGTIDVIATDHAPHSVEEKALPVGKAPNGIIGLETSLAVTLTYLYHTGILTLNRIVELMSVNPAWILGLTEGQSHCHFWNQRGTRSRKGSKSDNGTVLLLPEEDTVVFDPDEEWIVDPEQLRSKARNTPYAGMKLRGCVKCTVCRGKVVFES